MKKICKALLLAVLAMLTLTVFAACGGNTDSTGGAANVSGKEADYSVCVTDAAGTPITEGVVVKFMQGQTQAAMQVVNAEGKATKTLTRGDYTVQLQFTGKASYAVPEGEMTLSAEKTELSIVLYNELGESVRDIYINEQMENAYYVSTGCTRVPLNAEKRSHFLFRPTQPGTYEFSVIDSNAAIGGYGSPHAVQTISVVDVEDNKFKLSVKASQIGSGEGNSVVIVVGLDAHEGDAVLSIQRIGEPEWSVADEPWTTYERTAVLSPYTLPAGTTLKEFDLTASTDTYDLVYNEQDGFYHLGSADGKLVYVQLGGAESEEAGYAAPFQVMMQHVNIGRYFFDEEGKFLKKEYYTPCLKDYLEAMDEKAGVYPLTEDLKYIIQNRGIHCGWFDPESKGYIFVDSNGGKVPGINNEISWLFMCRYAA